MALFDVFKRKPKSKAESKLKRPPKGVLKKSDKKISPVKKKKGSQGVRSKEAKKDASVQASSKREELAQTKSKKKKSVALSDVASIILSAPHITEKASLLSEKNVYVFKVSKRANKPIVKRAVKELYGLDALKVNIINIPSKTRVSRGKKGRKPGYKKAMIYLKEGDEIELV